MMEISSKIGNIQVSEDRILNFPRGLVGYPKARHFILVQLKDNPTFMLLQNVENQQLGLFVVEPFGFMPDYQVQVGNTEEKILRVRTIDELTILVSVSIPHGRPENTALNLAGPILVNTRKKIGLQVPQLLMGRPGQVYVSELKGNDAHNENMSAD